jgi:hypothetical protein
MNLGLEGVRKGCRRGSRHSIVGLARLSAFTDTAAKARNFGNCENFNGRDDGESRPPTSAIFRGFDSFP